MALITILPCLKDKVKGHKDCPCCFCQQIKIIKEMEKELKELRKGKKK